MGSSPTKEEVITKLNDLEKKEFDINLKLKDLQSELNKIVPEEEQIKINEKLVPDLFNQHQQMVANLQQTENTIPQKVKKKKKKKKKKKVDNPPNQ